MSRFKSLLLTAGAATAVVTGMAATANAQVAAYGGGASLPAPFVRQAGDCYSNKTDLVFKGSPSTFVPLSDFNYLGTPSFDCATTNVQNNQTVFYVSTGSGTGIQTYYSHNPSLLGDTSPAAGDQRSEEHTSEECVGTCRFRWSPYH